MSFSLKDLFGAGAKNFENLRDVLLTGRAALEAKRAQFPDLAAQIDPQIADIDAKIAALEEPLSETAIAGLAVAVLPEALNIIKGKLESKAHSGDFA